jgi:RNA polymerase sigma-70 factor (ECF subfamily)
MPRDSSSFHLLRRAQNGDRAALDDLLERVLPPLRWWARGRLPRWARAGLDTSDIVQDSVLRLVRRIDAFEDRRQGALKAYLRQAIANRIVDACREARREPAGVELPEDHPDSTPTPFDQAVGEEVASRYRAGLAALSEDERAAIVGRVELGYSYEQLALALEKPTADAARMAVSRALVRLAASMGHVVQ